MVPPSMYCLEDAAVCIAVAVPTIRLLLNSTFFFILVKNRGAESESESPGIEATSQEAESESDLIQQPQLRRRIFYHNSTGVRASQKLFFNELFGNIAFSNFPSQHCTTMKDSDSKFSVAYSLIYFFQFYGLIF